MNRNKIAPPRHFQYSIGDGGGGKEIMRRKSLLLLCYLRAAEGFGFAAYSGLSVLAQRGVKSRARHEPFMSTTFDIGRWLSKIFPVAADERTKLDKPMKDAVLVVGASGKTGSAVVRALLATGRSVVAAARDGIRAETAIGEEATASPGLRVAAGIDVTDAATLSPALFRGVTQVVSCVGPIFSDPALNSENVDYNGNMALKAAAEGAGLDAASETSEKLQPLVIFPAGAAPGAFETPAGAAAAAASAAAAVTKEGAASAGSGAFSRLDDVIMGGQSSSAWQYTGGAPFGRWGGQLIVEGGGFCGTVVRSLPFDVSGYDGMYLKVRGDGGRYKFRLKPTDVAGTNEYQYQAPFDTWGSFNGEMTGDAAAGPWQEVRLPFEDFVAVRRNDVVYSAPPVNGGPSGGSMASLGLVYSRFEFNEMPNPRCQPGTFYLETAEIGMYRAARPSFLLVSSAATERFNRLASPEERAKDIPIVQLNPQGILNFKYKFETALRLSPLRHCVIRATGLLPEAAAGDGPVPLQAYQGDTVAGRVTRSEVAAAVAAALAGPHATGKTFELRRDETEASRGQKGDLQAMLRVLVPDTDRLTRSRGLKPFPAPRDPPPPVTAEERAKVLADPRVQSQQQRDAGAPGGG
ncbi:unnamed protein product [Phaeothamnion confervicola]